MKFEIEQELAQSVIDYLVKQPFEEVVTLVNGLSRMQPIAETNGQVEQFDLGEMQEQT